MIVLAALLIALVAFAVPLLHWYNTLAHDWDYFNSLSWLIRTNIVHYGEWNVHDPWGCGGLDVWANPQHRMLSPLGLLDLTLPPHLANIAGLMLHATAGAIGAYYFFRHFKIGKPAALTCAFLFINGSWFSLHYVAGHIPFGGMQLLPWAGVLAFRIRERKIQFATAAFLAFLVLDGAIYAAIFSVYLMVTLWLIYRIRPAFHPLLVFALVATAAVKMLPIFAATGSSPIRNDASVIGLRLLARMLFDPRQYSTGEYLFEHLRFHEFGCYIGVPLAALLIWGRRHLRPFAVALVLWFWAATAWLTPVNPWSIHRILPLVNTAHVQSRVLLIVFLLLLVAAGLALTESKYRWAIIGVLLLESVAVRTYTWERAYRENSRPPLPLSKIEKTTITHTLQSAEKPHQYQEPNAGVHNCYEPSLRQKKRLAVASDMSDYRGEAWVYGPAIGPPQTPPGTATLTRYVPAEIKLHYEVTPPAYIVLNTRHNGGWRSDDAEVVSNSRELLAIRVTQASGDVTIRYRPAYRPFQIACGLLAVLAFCASAWLCLRPNGRQQQAPSS